VKEFMSQVPLPEKKNVFKTGGPIIQMDGVKKYYYSIDRGVVKAVDGIDLVVDEVKSLVLLDERCWKNNLSRILTD